MMSPFDFFRETVQSLQPKIAVVLGSGLGNIPYSFQPIASIPFADVPGLVPTGVVGHSGKIAVGTCNNQSLFVYYGRLHFYEGHSWDRVSKPIEIAAELGVQTLILTNAAGGIHDRLDPGSLMVIEDHLFLQKPDTWKGSLVESPRPSVYSTEIIDAIQRLETQQGREILAGIYAALTGPSYETPAEIRALKVMGADAVGMSTAWEAETAHRLGLRCAGISCITNKAAGLAGKPLDHQEVLETAKHAVGRISELIERLIAGI
jgi:purine-nucleoside phosphorylase